MVWNINAYNIPRIRSYEEALKFYESADNSPASNGWRALCRKRDTSKIIRHDSAGDIRIRYHHTDVVTYKPDGRVVVQPYDSVNTVAFADRVLPNGVVARSTGGKMWVGDLDGVYQPVQNELVFLQGPNKWFVDKTTVAPVTQYQLDRSKAAAIRKTMKPFTDWIESAIRVGAKFYSSGRYRNAPHWLKEHLTAGYIPEARYAQLAELHLEMRDIYVMGGAVTKELAPCGSLPQKSVYDGSPAWADI